MSKDNTKIKKDYAYWKNLALERLGEIDIIAPKLENANKQIINLNQDLELSKTRIVAKNKLNLEQKERLNTIKQEKEVLLKELNEIKRKIQERRGRQPEKEAEKKKLEADIRKLNTEIERINKLNKELEELNIDLAEKNENLTKIKETNRDLTKSNEVLNLRVTKLLERVADYDKVKPNLIDKIKTPNFFMGAVIALVIVQAPIDAYVLALGLTDMPFGMALSIGIGFGLILELGTMLLVVVGATRFAFYSAMVTFILGLYSFGVPTSDDLVYIITYGSLCSTIPVLSFTFAMLAKRFEKEAMIKQGYKSELDFFQNAPTEKINKLELLRGVGKPTILSLLKLKISSSK